MKRKDGGRGLSGVEYVVREEENNLRFYVFNSEEVDPRSAATWNNCNRKNNQQK